MAEPAFPVGGAFDLPAPVAEDPGLALGGRMLLVEARCHAWPQRGKFPADSSMLL